MEHTEVHIHADVRARGAHDTSQHTQTTSDIPKALDICFVYSVPMSHERMQRSIGFMQTTQNL